MLGFHAFSEAPLSSSVEGVVLSGRASLASTASVVTASLKAIIGSGSPFTLGFNVGFEKGSRLTATATITQNSLESTATLSAIPTLVSGDLIFAESLSLQSSTSFGVNSVLLVGPSHTFASQSAIQATLSSSTDRADSALFTLYLDKGRSLPLNIYAGIDIAAYIDRLSDHSSYLDKATLNTRYVDKSVEQVLVRE